MRGRILRGDVGAEDPVIPNTNLADGSQNSGRPALGLRSGHGPSLVPARQGDKLEDEPLIRKRMERISSRHAPAIVRMSEEDEPHNVRLILGPPLLGCELVQLA